jgi:cytochrome c
MQLKISFGIFLLLVLAACQNSPSTVTTEQTTAVEKSGEAASPTSDPVYQKGLALVGKSDCLTCHKIDDKLMGPSYREIASKYADAPNDVVTALAGKIIAGGVGNWGNVPMTPHPSLSQEDAETMVRYILTLNKKG